MKRLLSACLPLITIVLLTAQGFAQNIDFRPKMDSLFSGLETHNKFMGTVSWKRTINLWERFPS